MTFILKNATKKHLFKKMLLKKKIQQTMIRQTNKPKCHTAKPAPT